MKYECIHDGKGKKYHSKRQDTENHGEENYSNGSTGGNFMEFFNRLHDFLSSKWQSSMELLPRTLLMC